jgi:hypothetical protein
LLQSQPVLDAFEGLLDAPAGMVKIAESGGWVVPLIQS